MKLVEQTADDRTDVEKARDNYNILAKDIGASVNRKMTPKRWKKLEDALEMIGGLEEWNECLEIASRSPFLRGEIPPIPPRTKPFKLTLRFMCQEESLLGIYEGDYND